jgi:hypothetical protein
MDCHHTGNCSIKVVPFADLDLCIVSLVDCCIARRLLDQHEHVMIMLAESCRAIVLMNSLFRHQGICSLPLIAYGYIDDSSKQQGGLLLST